MKSEINSIVNYHELCYICEHIFQNTHTVLYVCKEDGEWQFLCGEMHEENALPRVVGLGHILEEDKSIESLLDLPNGWEAERKSAIAEWNRSPLSD